MDKINRKHNLGLIMAVYLLGIFMGAIDTGIVTPARTIIQGDLGVDATTGIWMITIYTLAYAASIPIMGKLADKFGRKYIYLICILLFGVGSFLCGMSQNIGSFSVLLIARVIQAIGGGGIVPVATAEFGTTFPKEKRGMALGLVGGVYGIANIFGSSAGSAILDIFGKDNWQFIFYINVPITIFILIARIISLPNTRNTKVLKIDFFGIITLTMMVLSLLYGLKNIDFFAFTDTITSINVFPFLIAFLLLLPVFIFAEKKAEDPVLNLSYFTNKRIVITLIISMVTGIVMMGMIFVPQFAENALKITSGSGGYLVIILGIFAGVGAPLSGKLIDKYGAKLVLMIGFLFSIGGSLFLIFITTKHPNMLTVAVCLILMGLGIGFTMGTPINYMMLDNTTAEESNSALAAVSLVRSIGTAIAPAIMVGFIAHAGMSVQGNIMALLPAEINMPELPYATELSETFDILKKDPAMAAQLEGIEIPDPGSMQTISFDPSANSEIALSEELISSMKSSDVTTITKITKEMADYMFAQMTPGVMTSITGGIENGITTMTSTKDQMDAAISNMPAEKTTEMSMVSKQLADTIRKMQELSAAIPGAFEQAKENYLSEIDAASNAIEAEYQKTLNKGFIQIYLTVVIAAAGALVLLMFYKERNKKEV